METSNMMILIRRFLTKTLDIRNLLNMSKPSFRVFKGLQGYIFKAVGRFARRGRALKFSAKFGLNYSRLHDIPADYSAYSFPLLFGIGNLQAIFFYAERFYFKTYLKKKKLVRKVRRFFKRRFFKKPIKRKFKRYRHKHKPRFRYKHKFKPKKRRKLSFLKEVYKKLVD
jgi:hypothetical protein